MTNPVTLDWIAVFRPILSWVFGAGSRRIEFRQPARFNSWVKSSTGMLKVGLVSRDSRDRGLTSQHKGARDLRLLAYKGFALASALAALALSPSMASAQLNSNTGSVSLNATMTSSVTITAAPGLVNFALLRSGVSTGSAPVSITSSWTVPFLFGNVNEYAYFTTSAAALTDGAGDNIPSANVAGSFNGGAFAAFTGNSPFAAGSSITLFNQFIFIFNTTGTRTDTLNLRINTTGLTLPAGTYTGLLHIQAQAL